MIRVLLVALFIGVSAPVAAETVVVRSGDHASFTRLTLSLPDRATWRVIEGETEVEISIGGISPNFDLSTVFDRIARDRVGSVSATPASLRVAITCDCSTEAFQTSSGLVVLDVVDKADTETFSLADLMGRSGTSFSYRFTPGQFEQNRTDASVQRAGQQLMIVQPDLTEPSLMPSAQTEQAAVENTGDILQGQSYLPVVDQRVLKDARARQKDVSAAEDRLVRQMSRASGQGLLTLEQSGTFDRPTQADSTPTILETVNIDRKPGGSLARGLNLTTSSALDESRQALAEVLRFSQSGLSCTPDTEIALAEWANGSSFDSQIAQRRLALYGEFDRLDTEAALKLAQTYLHFGFGSEAHQILMLPEMGPVDRSVLLSLASIFEERIYVEMNEFVGQENCGSDSALWAVLISENIEVVRSADSEAVTRGFARLPDPVQDHIAARLIDPFVEIGDLTTADAIRRIVERNAEVSKTQPQLSNVSLAEASGDLEVAHEMREEILRNNTIETPQALIEIISKAWREGNGIDPSLIPLLDAFRLEHRNSSIAPSIDQARLRGLSMIGDFGAAFRILEGAAAGADKPELLADFMRAVSEKGSDFDAIRYSFLLDSSAIAELPFDTLDRLAERLLALGFPDQALRLTDFNQDGSASKARRLIRANAALSLQDTERAIEEVAGLTGINASVIRARANFKKGEWEQASTEFQAAERIEEARRVQWLSGQINPEEDSVGNYTTPVVDIEPEGSPGSLLNTRDLLQNSIEARASLTGFLQSHGFSAEALPISNTD